MIVTIKLMDPDEALKWLSQPGIMSGFLAVDGDTNRAIYTLGKLYREGYRLRKEDDYEQTDKI